MSNVFSFDVVKDLRYNSKLRNAVTSAMKDVDIISHAVRDGKATMSDLSRAQSKLIPLCGFNFGMLMPQFFTSYPEDKPLSFLERPFMFSMTSMAPGAIVTLMSSRQIGKCADADTEVETLNHGKLTLGDIFAMGVETL